MTMKEQQPIKPHDAPNKSQVREQPAPHQATDAQSASGKWTASQRVRLPHRVGLPLGCGGGDGLER